MAQKDYGTLRYLPPHARMISPDDNSKKENYVLGMQNGRKQGIRPPQAAESKPPLQQAASKPLKNQYNRASGGPRMQAIFLGSKPRSCGTGVFIPRTEGIDFHLGNNNKPVLLHSPVVQTLNLNVHEMGQQIKPQTVQPINNVAEDLEKNKKPDNNDMYSSQEIIILPEEWTYDVL